MAHGASGAPRVSFQHPGNRGRVADLRYVPVLAARFPARCRAKIIGLLPSLSPSGLVENGVGGEDDLRVGARRPDPDDESTDRHAITCLSVLSCGARRARSLGGPAQAPHRSHRPRQHPKSRPRRPARRSNSPRERPYRPGTHGPFSNSPYHDGGKADDLGTRRANPVKRAAGERSCEATHHTGCQYRPCSGMKHPEPPLSGGRSVHGHAVRLVVEPEPGIKQIADDNGILAPDQDPADIHVPGIPPGRRQHGR